MYEYVELKSQGFFKARVKYKDIINEYSKKKFRFITSIPKESNTHGVATILDLVFEKNIQDIEYMYNYVEIKTSGKVKLKSDEYRDIIDNYEKRNYKLITTLITEYDGYGAIKTLDLIFEKICN
ncbi:TPA: DUF4177 domain-containing protein [Clostridioides difficile]|nr:DUF4177 domain-containing protein [Clostridioides difficile]